MKKHLSLLGMGLLLMSALAYADTATMKVNIPFSFVVGKTTLPAGEYSVRGLGIAENAISIRKSDNAANSLTMSIPCESLKAPEQSKLVFHRYGNRYFLAEIWTAGNSWGHEFPKSRREAEMALDYQVQKVVLVASLR
jgi:hypothetical protein